MCSKTNLNYKELYIKYQTLLNENTTLKTEIKRLTLLIETLELPKNVLFSKTASLSNIPNQINDNKGSIGHTQNLSTNKDKINLFLSFFKVRLDVYAKRWQNRAGKSGYAPVCLNEWQRGVCFKPEIKCFVCSQKLYAVLDEDVIEDHLKGHVVVGGYPMCLDETCCFLAMDFDDADWQKDVSVMREVCCMFNIPCAVERSRSGNGAHIWFFFEDKISAAIARKFGTALLTYAMNERHEITFKSYDRLFPSQDTMPKGGLGNLIALPLQMSARKNGNAVFVDENFEPYSDQWEFLRGFKKLSEDQLETLTNRLCAGNELGILKRDEEDVQKPWEPKRVKTQLTVTDFPKDVEIVKADMLYIFKDGFSQRALNVLKRMAAFKNPEFYKAQAMRMPTYNKPRIISCSDELDAHLCLPRGCEAEILNLLNEFHIDVYWIDKMNPGRGIKAEFNGILREDQPHAVEALLKFDNGVLSATTAFGKTVIAAYLIAEKKVNTLILVHRQQLLSQWIDKLSEFLSIHEALPVLEKKRGRKKEQSLIGQLGAGKNNLSGIIDIAIMQSLNNSGEVKEHIRNYGMVIVDECHHVPAFSFEQILKKINAKFVYGLTATPARQDGHHPIIFLYCGPIRYRVDAKKEAEKRPFDHYVIPRFTDLREPIDKDAKELSIQELYTEITVNETRNQLIVDDVVKGYGNSRNSLVLTERTAHVELIVKRLSEKIPDVIGLTGSMSNNEKESVLNQIHSTPPNKPLVLVATGKYIGEGFDEPRLDTLFLATPISWKGTLQQYAGRLHRLYKNKNEVQIYDYVDIHVRMLEKMYGKRLNGYASIGYKARGDSVAVEHTNIIFDKNNFFPVYINDITTAAREVLIISPFVTKKRVAQMLHYFSVMIDKQIKVTVITRPVNDFSEKREMVMKQIFDVLENNGIDLIFKSKIHQKFAIIDQKTVWYGSINLLSFGNAEESIMRIESGNIANELVKSVARN